MLTQEFPCECQAWRWAERNPPAAPSLQEGAALDLGCLGVTAEAPTLPTPLLLISPVSSWIQAETSWLSPAGAAD